MKWDFRLAIYTSWERWYYFRYYQPAYAHWEYDFTDPAAREYWSNYLGVWA